MNFVGFAQGRLLLIKACRWCEPFWRTIAYYAGPLRRTCFLLRFMASNFGAAKICYFLGWIQWMVSILGAMPSLWKKGWRGPLFCRSNLNPSLVFAYLRKPSCGARNMNVAGPPKTVHIRGHNGCVLVVLHFWDWAWLLVWSLLILQHGFDRLETGQRGQFEGAF